MFWNTSIRAALKMKYAPTESNAAREPVRTSNVFTYIVPGHWFNSLKKKERERFLDQVGEMVETHCYVDLNQVPREFFLPPLE